ncbi:MAG: hypothetical protein ACE5G1_00215 [bacterium]
MLKTLFIGISVFIILTLSACKSQQPLDIQPTDSNPALTGIIADPITVVPGGASVVTIQMLNADPRTLDVTYQATGGIIQGSGAEVTFVAGNMESIAWVDVSVDAGQGNILSGSASINITASPPLISVGVQILTATTSNTQCLAFTALAADTVSITGADVLNPNNQTFMVPDSGNLLTPRTLLPGDTLTMQSQGTCYTLFSGTYEFSFSLQGQAEPFRVTYVQQ